MLFTRGEKVSNPLDDSIRDVICAQFPDQKLVVDEVKSFFEVKKDHSHRCPVTVSSILPGVSHANYGFGST